MEKGDQNIKVKGWNLSIEVGMLAIQPDENNQNRESNFELLDRLKRYLDELYYQIKLFSKLSNEDRSRLFVRYRAVDLIGIISFLRKQEHSSDKLMRRMSAKLTERCLQILRKMEAERDVQMRMGIHRDLPVMSVEQKELRETLQKGLEKLDLDPSQIQKIQAEFGIFHDLGEEDPLSAGETEVSDGESLDELFARIFSGPRIDRSALFDFLSNDSASIVEFLEEKSKSEDDEEQVRALELTRLVPRKDTIDLLGRILTRSQGEIRKKTDGILNWYRSQDRFRKYHRLIDAIRDQMRRKAQIYSRKMRQERENEERKELYLEYFEMISDPHEEDRMSLLKGLGSEGYRKNQRFVTKVFERDQSVTIRSQILKDIARYRIEELFTLFEKAFLSEEESLIYHAVLYVKEYSLCSVLVPLQKHKPKFKTFNEQFATQVVALLA